MAARTHVPFGAFSSHVVAVHRVLVVEIDVALGVSVGESGLPREASAVHAL